MLLAVYILPKQRRSRSSPFWKLCFAKAKAVKGVRSNSVELSQHSMVARRPCMNTSTPPGGAVPSRTAEGEFTNNVEGGYFVDVF